MTSLIGVFLSCPSERLGLLDNEQTLSDVQAAAQVRRGLERTATSQPDNSGV
jgi:hypothetical protein